MRQRKQQIQARIFTDDDTEIIVIGTETNHIAYGEYWGYEYRDDETETEWTGAIDAETGEAVTLTNEMIEAAEGEEIEY